MADFTTTNLKNWDNRVDIHYGQNDFYDVEAFQQGACTLREPELEAIGNVTGKSLLHLQCHFGMDSISWARRGADVTAVDFSPKAVNLARQLSAEQNIPVHFIESDVLKLDLNQQFDCVVATYGILCWIGDLDLWASVAAKHLKAGGIFYFIDDHPVFRMLDMDEQTGRLFVAHDYFNKGPEHSLCEYSYTGNEKMTARDAYEWSHSMAEILNALISAGLKITKIDELNELFFKPWWHDSIEVSKGWWKPPHEEHKIPLTLAITATK